VFALPTALVTDTASSTSAGLPLTVGMLQLALNAALHHTHNRTNAAITLRKLSVHVHMYTYAAARQWRSSSSSRGLRCLRRHDHTGDPYGQERLAIAE
jgi:hypothetical protein